MKRDPLPLTMPMDTTATAAWARALPAFAAVLVVMCVAYASTLAGIVAIWWRSSTFTHGFLVVPIVAWLAWRKRGRLRLLTPSPYRPAVAVLALLGLAWLAAQYVAVNVVAQAAFVAMIIAAVPAIFGIEVARTLAFPLAFLLFAIPAGDFMLPTLMDWTANFTVLALRATGVPVYRDGWLIIVPNGRWSVVEACSGIRYLIASLVTGTLFAYLTYRRLSRRIAFVAFAGVVAIVANWLRAYLIVLLGYLTSNKLAAGVDHLVYGWIFFGVVMVGVFYIGSVWREPEEPDVHDRLPVAPPFARTFDARLVAIAFGCVALVWPLLNTATQIRDDGSKPSLTFAPPAGWMPAVDATELEPVFAAPSATLVQSLQKGAERATIHIAYYRAQSPERKAVSSENVLTREEDKRFARTVRSPRVVSIGGVPRRIVETRLDGRGGSVVAWQWYWVDGAVTSSEAEAKARIGWSRLTKHRDDAAAILFYAQDGNGQSAEQVLAQLAHDAWPAIAQSLARAEHAP